VALCQARTSTKPLWGLSSSNPYHPSHVPNNTLYLSVLPYLLGLVLGSASPKLSL
jgi:hypothetical protein